MTLAQLQILQQIIEQGSLKKAALALHKTQPALTMAIKKLEAEFGFKILDRNSYRLTLTALGRTFYREAQLLLSDTEQLQSLGHQLAQGNEAVFKVCYEQVCPNNLFMAAVNKTYRAFPATEFHLHSGLRFTSLEKVNNESVDIGIGPWFHLFHAQGEFDSFSIGQFDIVLVASPLLLADHPVQYYSQLRQLSSVTMAESEFNFDSDKLAYSQGCQQVKVYDILALKALLLSGAGCGFIPSHHIEQEIANGQLEIIKLKDKEYQFNGDIRVFRMANKNPGPVSQYLWQALKSTQLP